MEDQNEAVKRFQKNKDAQRFQVAQCVFFLIGFYVIPYYPIVFYSVSRIRNHMKLDEKKRMEAQIEGEELEKLSIQFIKEKQRMVRLSVRILAKIT